MKINFDSDDPMRLLVSRVLLDGEDITHDVVRLDTAAGMVECVEYTGPLGPGGGREVKRKSPGSSEAATYFRYGNVTVQMHSGEIFLPEALREPFDPFAVFAHGAIYAEVIRLLSIDEQTLEVNTPGPLTGLTAYPLSAPVERVARDQRGNAVPVTMMPDAYTLGQKSVTVIKEGDKVYYGRPVARPSA